MTELISKRVWNALMPLSADEMQTALDDLRNRGETIMIIDTEGHAKRVDPSDFYRPPPT
jgi:hypothetical protein